MKKQEQISFDEKNVEKISSLARIPLTKEEKEKLVSQLSKTINYVDILQKVDTSKVKHTTQVTGLENVFREDKVLPSISQKEALRNASRTHNGYFVVDAVLAGD